MTASSPSGSWASVLALPNSDQSNPFVPYLAFSWPDTEVATGGSCSIVQTVHCVLPTQVGRRNSAFCRSKDHKDVGLAKSACLRQKSLNQFAEKIQPLNPIISREFLQNDAIVAEALAPKAALPIKKWWTSAPGSLTGHFMRPQ